MVSAPPATSTTVQNSEEQSALEKVKIQQGYTSRNRELDLKERELDFKKLENRLEKKRRALTLAIVATILGGFSGITVMASTPSATPIATQNSEEQSALEKVKIQQDYELRKRELDLKERELNFKESEAKLEKWRNPLMLAIVAAILGGFTSVTVTFLQNRAAQEATRAKAKADLILESTKTPDRAVGKENLRFLIQAKLIDDPNQEISKLLDKDVYPSFAATRFAAPFPNVLSSLVQLFDSAKYRLQIVTDVCNYGSFSNPQEYSKYVAALKKAVERGVVVKMYNYDDRLFNQILGSQFNSFEDLSRSAAFHSHFEQYSNGVVPQNMDEFVQHMNAERHGCEEMLRNYGVHVQQSFPFGIPLFVWMRDDDEAIFAISNVGPNAREVALATRDSALIRFLEEVIPKDE